MRPLLQPHAREFPVTFHRLAGHAQRRRRFFDGEPRKEAQFHHLHRPRIDFRQAPQGVVDGDQPAWIALDKRDGIPENGVFTSLR